MDLAARANEDQHGRRYWALAGKPERYRLMDAVRELEIDSWTTVGRDLRPGDRVIIWKYKGREENRGAIALGEVLSFPEPAAAIDVEENFEYWQDADDLFRVDERAFIRYVKVLDPPLWLDGPYHDIVGDLSVSRSQGGTVFNVSPEQWSAILQVVGGWPEDNEIAPEQEAAIEEIAAIVEGRIRVSSYRQSALERRAIEQYAMNQAIEHLRRHGWEVEDVSATRSYDLRCVDFEGIELHVEVKGTTGAGSTVLLTRKEVDYARSSGKSALFLVHSIQLRGSGSNVDAFGGQSIIYDPWDIESGTLLPMNYEYRVPKDGGEEADIYENV